MGCRGLNGGNDTLKRNFSATPNYTTLLMWRIVIGGGVAYGPTIIPPSTTTHHMDGSWIKLCN